MKKNITTILSLGLSLMAAKGASAAAEKPNILFLSIDDLRPELGCYGSPQVISPHMDRLAADGLVFMRAYCQVPVCGASRASLMTGILPTRSRFTSFNSRADRDTPDAATLPQVFKEAGYTTLSNGKIFHHSADFEEVSWSEPAWDPELQFMHSHDPETTRRLSARNRGRIYEYPDVPDDAYYDGELAERTIADLRRLKEAGEPFFLAVGFFNPHLPFYAPKRYWDLYERDKIDIAEFRRRPLNAPRELRGSGEYHSYHLGDYEDNSDAFHRVMRHGYLASTSYVDKLVGDILDELKELGLADNTIIVLWGDHGFHLGEYNFWGKHNNMRLSLRVPLIIRVPDSQTGVTDALVESSDLFPTLCKLAGIPIPETVQGKSFDALFEQPEQPFREVVYSRIRDADTAITERFTFTRFGSGAEMLYDLEADPHETVNVAGEDAYAQHIEKMRTLLEQRMAEAAAIEF